MSENDTSTLTNTGKMHVYFSQLAHCFHSWLTGIFQAVLPWKLSKEIFKAMQMCRLEKGT
jgi:hypothetical protein